MPSAKRRSRTRKSSGSTRVCATLDELDTFWETWLALTPAERLRRSWSLRRRVVDLDAVHDAKLHPQP